MREGRISLNVVFKRKILSRLKFGLLRVFRDDTFFLSVK